MCVKKRERLSPNKVSWPGFSPTTECINGEDRDQGGFLWSGAKHRQPG